MYQLDGLASLQIFHQDPDIHCNHPHCDNMKAHTCSSSHGFECHRGKHLTSESHSCTLCISVLCVVVGVGSVEEATL